MPPSDAFPRSGPSLRLEEFAITNFRTFTTRTVIPFRSGSAEPDAIATFHGDNGSGKSNALKALNLFFHALIRFLRDAPGDKAFMLEWGKGTEADRFVITPRDRPVDAEGPTELEAHFADHRLGVLRVRFTPAGNRVNLRAERRQPQEGGPWQDLYKLDRDEVYQLLTWIETPLGPDSIPCAVLDANRHSSFKPGVDASHLDEMLAEALLQLRTSFNPGDRDRWRSFTEQLRKFSTLQNKEVSVDRLAGQGTPELTFEERGRSVLALKDLSSGEQQLVKLCAVTTLMASPILAIQEPELSLDITNQNLFLEILRSQIQMSLRDQIILESHVFTFDGPSVIRFSRTASGPTQVTRAPGANESDRAFAETAQAKGAKKQFVTRDGYTQLPDIMLKDLQFVDGGHLWFLKGKNAWEAWREEDLATLLADPETDKDHE